MTTCPACGTELPTAARFCPSCGQPLEGSAGAEMLKLASILFADVVESTARGERMHPEDTRALMRDYFDAMAQEIRAEGGTLEKFVGDAIMAVFGVPEAHEDDPLRAVRAARRMLDRLERWNEEHAEDERLQIRIGINTGDVIAADSQARDLLVTGDAVNVAARLEQTAEPGTIVVGDRTARAVRGFFTLRELARLALKGKADHVAAYVVEGEREVPEERGVPGLRAPIVGRDGELEVLRTTFERVQSERRPHLVTVIADAGVGKSRLVREFVSSLEDETKVVAGRSLPYGSGVTLWPLAEILKSEAIVLDNDPPDVALAKIAQLINASVDPRLRSERTLAALASTIGLHPAEDPLDGLDPREVYRELLTAWRALLASLARSVPVVAVIEDIHWADETMLDVLDELAERVAGALLFVCTARPDLLRTRPDWGGGRRNFTSLPLDPLSSEDSERLIAALLAVDELPQSLRDRILERAEGNPFFLEEIIRHLIDDGALVEREGRWHASERLETVEIPDTVQAVILARLDLLGTDEKRAVQQAAVVGRIFWDGAVAELAAIEDVEAVLRTLRRRELVLDRLSSSIAGEAEYIFKHVLIRDVAYESLPRRERADAHARVAQWIEEVSGVRVDEFAELLAHHYDAAHALAPREEWRTTARRHLMSAGQNALGRFAVQQAARFASRAVELSHPGERLDALEALGDLYYLTFDGDAAWKAYRLALAEAPDQSRTFARLAAKAGLFARWTGMMQNPAAVDELSALITAGLAAAGDENSAERTLLLVDRAFLLAHHQGRTDAETEDAVRACVAAAEALVDPDLLSAAYDSLHAWETENGRYGEAYRANVRRLEFVPRMRDVREVCDSHAMVAWSAFHRGLYAETLEQATQCVERARGVDVGSYLHGLAWRVGAHFMCGDWDSALADQAELERVAEEDIRELPVAYSMRAYATVSFCHELRGNKGAAEQYLELIGRYVKTRGERSIHVGPAIRALAHAGRTAEARDLSYVERRTQRAVVVLEARCDLVGEAAVWDEAEEVVSAARQEADWGEHLALSLFADRLEGRAAAAGGDLERAEALLRRSAEGFAGLGAPWEEAWSRLLLAEALDSGDEAEAALPVFERLGSVQELKRARALLRHVKSPAERG